MAQCNRCGVTWGDWWFGEVATCTPCRNDLKARESERRRTAMMQTARMLPGGEHVAGRKEQEAMAQIGTLTMQLDMTQFNEAMERMRESLDGSGIAAMLKASAALELAREKLTEAKDLSVHVGQAPQPQGRALAFGELP